MPSDGALYVIIAVTLVGFIALAFVLLFPVWRFLRRQERLADDWTPEALARRRRGGPRRPTDGRTTDGRTTDGRTTDGRTTDGRPASDDPADR